MHTRKVLFVSASLMIASLLLVRCKSPESKAAEEGNATAPAEVAIEAFSLSKSAMLSNIKIPGELVAYQQVDLYAKVNSFVKKMNVDVGSVVATGQLLATMEAPEIGSQLNGAESRLKAQQAIYIASKATYNRLLETSKTPGTVSQNDLDLALAKQNSDYAQFQSAQASLKEVGANRNYLEIRAPFPGIITARNVSQGAYVGPSGKGSELPLFTLQQQDRLRLVVSVPEAYTGYLNNQSKVNFTVRSLPNNIFNAKVARLAGALDSRLRSQRTEMDVINTGKNLLPGMVAEVELPLSDKVNNFVVPSDAILNSTQGTFVIKLVRDSSFWVPIKTGRNTDGKTEIFGALNVSDVLLAKATEETRDKASVKAKIKVN